MISLAVTFALAFAPGMEGVAQSGHAAAMEALERGRVDLAATALAAEPDLRLRQEGRARLYQVAGDPTATVREAARGLADHPDDLRLLYFASHGALYFSAELAEHYTARLERAVEKSTDLTPDERGPWRETAARFRADAHQLGARDERRDTVTRRARVVALAVLTACLGLLVVLAVAGRFPVSAGRGDPS